MTVRRLFTSLRLHIHTRNLKGCTKLMQRIGPHWPLGVQNTLLFRAYCYEKQEQEMTQKAAEDLAFFTENQPHRLNSFLQMQSL
ncbi:MAG: hypothetical protein GY822_21500 [Deltaproteobacteria bacterium]|nr:hypothetical protein [Deltaproteobacteria bacterium]